MLQLVSWNNVLPPVGSLSRPAETYPCPQGSNGIQFICLYSIDIQHNGKDPSTQTDLGATIKITYQLNRAVLTSYVTTPGSVRADQDSGFTVTYYTSPLGGWLVSNLWNDNQGSEVQGSSATYPVGPIDHKVAAFFATTGTMYNVVFHSNIAGGSIALSGGGVITSGGASNFAAGSFTVVALPPLGYLFASWSPSGDVSITGGETALMTVSGSGSVTANFSPAAPSFLITVTTDPPELDSPKGQGVYSQGAIVTIGVDNPTNYTFLLWERDGINYTTAQTFDQTVDSSHIFTAVFRPGGDGACPQGSLGTRYVCLYSINEQFMGQDPYLKNDLNSQVSIKYTSGGVERQDLVMTPANVQVDAGSQFTVSYSQNPNGWTDANLWDDYGQGGQTHASSATYNVGSTDHRAIAYFVPVQQTVDLYAIDYGMRGLDPSTMSTQLNAGIFATYYHGGATQTAIIKTPASLQVDQNSRVTFSIVWNPDDSTFGYLWNDYGLAGESSQANATYNVGTNNHKIAAYFIRGGGGTCDPNAVTYPANSWDRYWCTYTGNPNKPWGNHIPGSGQFSVNFDESWSDPSLSDNVMFTSGMSYLLSSEFAYKIAVKGNDGYRLYYDSMLVIDRWYNPGKSEALHNLKGDDAIHTFRLDWYENSPPAQISFNIQLSAITNETSQTTTSEPIPELHQLPLVLLATIIVTLNALQHARRSKFRFQD